MNLESTLLIMAGGEGSGCKGPNCGRPAKKAGGVMDQKLDDKAFNKKNMHDMSKVLEAHSFRKTEGGGGSRTGGAHQGRQYGATTRWSRLGKQEIPDLNNTMRLGEKFRSHSVTVNPAGWHHSSQFHDYVDHGRGLSADSLEKHLKEHGL